MYDVQSLPKPAGLEELETYIAAVWPELKNIPDVWMTGGQVWRRLLNVNSDEAKDVDLFVTSDDAMTQVVELCEQHGGEEYGEKYIGPLGGRMFYTDRGRVDVWIDDSAAATLRRYSDVKADKRVAYNPHLGLLLWLPPKVERVAGERYIRFEEATDERATILEWREWPGE